MKQPIGKRRAPAARGQRGITLLEVLVSVLIFSFGILGLVAMQARATQYSLDAEDRNRAALLVDDIAAQMHAIRSVNLSNEQLAAWQARVAATGPQGGVPNGQGAVSVAGNTATVTVTWLPPKAASDTDISTYSTQVTVLP
jgi:type IV pilus assembly protein PilV